MSFFEIQVDYDLQLDETMLNELNEEFYQLAQSAEELHYPTSL